VTSDAIDRRERTRERMAAESVFADPYWHLDLLPGEAETELPEAEEIVLRALALIVVAGEMTGMGNALVDKLIDHYRPRFSPAEWRWFENPARDPDESAWLSWSFEAALPLAWAVGLADALAPPTGQIEPFALIKPMVELPRDALLAKASVRPTAPILDAADLHHGYLRACRHASEEGREAPGRLDPYVVIQRNRAFRWLIGSPSRDWDVVVEAT
jgi:hypothetical protein